MKHKILIGSFLAAALSVFSVTAVAQHTQHHPQQQATQEQSKPGMMGHGMTGQGMMGPGMMGQQMMARHQDMAKMMDQLMQSMAGMENAKDMSAMKTRLAEHRALLEQIHEKMMQQGKMMPQMVDRMKNCPMMGQKDKPTSE